MTDWDALDRALAGELLVPGSAGYEVARKPAIVQFHHIRPRAVVRCANPSDVAAAISFARQHGLHTAVRSGGHCFAARSSTDGLVIDVGSMRSVSLDGEVATVEAGARLGDVYDALAEHGRTVPAGCGPTVGVAGHVLGGGLGILGRVHGFACDRLVAAQVVLADGRIVECDAEREPDLYWALRGAGGGNFGVVTSLSLRTVPAPESTSFHLIWPLEQIARVIEKWQDWAPDGPDELAGSLLLTAPADPAEPPVIHLFGTMAGGTAEEADAQLAEFVRLVGEEPVTSTRVRLSYRETKQYLAERGPGEDRPDAHLLSKSRFVGDPLPADAIQALVDIVSAQRVAGESRVLDLIPCGGAYNRVAADATAFPHRDARFLLKYTAILTPGQATDDSRQWLAKAWELVRPWGTGGAYSSFPDPDLVDGPAAYYGTNLDRLVRVKSTYDPSGFFRYHQSLPLRAGQPGTKG